MRSQKRRKRKAQRRNQVVQKIKRNLKAKIRAQRKRRAEIKMSQTHQITVVSRVVLSLGLARKIRNEDLLLREKVRMRDPFDLTKAINDTVHSDWRP